MEAKDKLNNSLQDYKSSPRDLSVIPEEEPNITTESSDVNENDSYAFRQFDIGKSLESLGNSLHKSQRNT